MAEEAKTAPESSAPSATPIDEMAEAKVLARFDAMHDKITAARDPRDGHPLPERGTRRMRKLVTIRNSLVHDREVNSIEDRADFVKGWNEVEAALQSALPGRGSSCVVC